VIVVWRFRVYCKHQNCEISVSIFVKVLTLTPFSLQASIIVRVPSQFTLVKSSRLLLSGEGEAQWKTTLTSSSAGNNS